MTAPRLGSRLFGLADEGKRAVVVDLSEVTFMDSTGIGVLLNALRHFTARHMKMVLVCPTDARPAPVPGHRSRGPPHDLRLAREGARLPRLRSAAGAGILVAVLLEALGRAVLGRRGVALGRVGGGRVGGRRPLERERLGGRVDGRRGRLGLLAVGAASVLGSESSGSSRVVSAGSSSPPQPAMAATSSSGSSRALRLSARRPEAAGRSAGSRSGRSGRAARGSIRTASGSRPQ